MLALGFVARGPVVRAAGGETGAPLAPQQRGDQGRGQRSGQPPRVGSISWEWWNDEDVKKELALSDQKVQRIQNYYQSRIRQLSPIADQFQREFQKLDQMTKERTVDDGTYSLQVTVVEALRSKLLESRTVMLYRMYMELSQDQYKKLLEIRDRKFRRGGGGGRPSL